jgi:DNA repair exonuclease SbcCD nuclease subunit
MKLVQTSDLHLGRRRLDGRLPDSDLADAFAHIAEAAIQEGADALLLAGDCFDKPQVEPPHLRQAQRVLGRLKQAGIPVIAIEGNHDKAFVHSDAPTWVHYLAEDGLLTLLRTPFDGDGPVLTPWDPAARTGSYLDLGGVRFVGAGYLGAATPHKVRELAERLDPERTHVLLLHAGPDYFVGEGGGFSAEDLRALHEKVCYLALGHIHKPMVHGNWACNAGSPENCDLREAGYDLDRNGAPTGRGYALVQLDPGSRAAPSALAVRSNPRRPVHQLVLDCTPFGNKLKDGAAALVRAAAAAIRAAGCGPAAVIDLKLTGRLNLARIALDQTLAAAEIEQAAQVTAVALDAAGLNLDGAALPGPDQPAQPTRELLERAAILQLVGNRNLFGLEDQDPAFAALFYQLKEGVRTGWDGEELAAHLDRSPLVDRILAAREVQS